jgi:hypothetical protein
MKNAGSNIIFFVSLLLLSQSPRIHWFGLDVFVSHEMNGGRKLSYVLLLKFLSFQTTFLETFPKEWISMNFLWNSFDPNKASVVISWTREAMLYITTVRAQVFWDITCLVIAEIGFFRRTNGALELTLESLWFANTMWDAVMWNIKWNARTECVGWLCLAVLIY